MQIERVTMEDAEELLEIYAPYVKDTAISFEYKIPSWKNLKNVYIMFHRSFLILRQWKMVGSQVMPMPVNLKDGRLITGLSKRRSI